MSKYFGCLLVAAMAALALALPQDNQAPFSITLSAANDIFKAGSEVKIRLVFKNISSEEVPYAKGLGTGIESQGEIFTEVLVRNAKGEAAPETKYYRALRGKADTTASPATPHKSGVPQDTVLRPESKPATGGQLHRVHAETR